MYPLFRSWRSYFLIWNNGWSCFLEVSIIPRLIIQILSLIFIGWTSWHRFVWSEHPKNGQPFRPRGASVWGWMGSSIHRLNPDFGCHVHRVLTVQWQGCCGVERTQEKCHDQTGFKQWGSEYRPFEYRKHLNTKLFEVWISNGSVFKWSVYGLCPMY